MKRFALSLLVTMIILSLSAQKNLVLTEGQPVVVYSLPKTSFSFDVEIEKVSQKPGQFFQYSQRYLATNDVITEEKVVYRVKSISMRTITIADPARTFKLETKNLLNFPTVNHKGILCGVNVTIPETKIIEKKILKDEKLKPVTANLLPLGEEFMMAGSTAKLAEGAAKQIYRIRESRMMLLGGDMEEQPSDGNALNTMLDGLNRTEAELTSLFVGKTQIETFTQSISIEPDSALINKVLFRLSAQRGIVDATDLGGAPFYISFTYDEIKTQNPDPKAKPESASIQTILPAKTNVKITDGIKTYLEKELQVPQFGILIPLSDKISNARNMKIRIDENTGRLLMIEK